MALGKLKPIALQLAPAFIFLIINFSSHGTADAVFVSFDCGMTGSSSYEDKNTIAWSGDDAYVNKRQSKVYQYSNNAESDWRNTARVFPTSAKNCYTVPIDKASRGKRLLVRASFYYWNFDDTTPSPDPPTFELDYDGNFWTSVVTQLLTSVSYEAIYFVQAETTSICLSKTKTDQQPFISALELRSLDVNTYSLVDPKFALLLTDTNRRAYGTNQTVRYPDDAYDRIWAPYGSLLYGKDVKSESVSIDTRRALDNPPVAVLQNAIQGATTLVYKDIDTSELPQQNVGIYLTIYFSEVVRVRPGAKRSIQVLLDGNPYSDAIIPPFGGVIAVYITNVTANSNTSITIQSTADSTLPFLINAYELYTLTGIPVTNTPNSPPDSTPTPPPPPPELQTPTPRGPSQIPNGIPTVGSGGCSDKVQMILGVMIQISILSFFYVQ